MHLCFLDHVTYMKTKHFILGILLCKAFLSLFESIEGFCCPPACEYAIFVIALTCMHKVKSINVNCKDLT